MRSIGEFVSCQIRFDKQIGRGCTRGQIEFHPQQADRSARSECLPDFLDGRVYSGSQVLIKRHLATKKSERETGFSNPGPIAPNLGVAIVSTSEGVMSDRDARAKGRGGEVLCIVA